MTRWLSDFLVGPVIQVNVNGFLSNQINPKVGVLVHVPNFGGLSGSEDRGGGDNSIQFINFGRVGDKSFEEWRQKIGGVEGWVTTMF